MRLTATTLMILLVQATAIRSAPKTPLSGLVTDAQTPIHFVEVIAVGENGEMSGRTVSDLEGKYRLWAEGEVRTLFFSDRENGRCCRVEGPWNTESTVDFEFNKRRFFRLQGSVVDQARSLMRAFMNPGEKWDGKFDHLVRPRITITAFVGKVKLIEMNPDERSPVLTRAARRSCRRPRGRRGVLRYARIERSL